MRTIITTTAALAALAIGCATKPATTDSRAEPLTERTVDETNLLQPATDIVVPEDAQFGGTLRTIIYSELKGLNWLVENSVDVSNLQGYVHNTVARRSFDNPDVWVKELADEVTVDEDNTAYTIHLRDDVYWHVPDVDFAKPENEWLEKPRRMTAADLAFYFELVTHPDVPAGAIKGYYEDLDAVEVVDEQTLIVRWKRPIHSSRSSTLGAYPLPRWLFSRDRDGDAIPAADVPRQFAAHWASELGIGTGAYRLVRASREEVVVERDEAFWGDRYPIERIVWKVMPSLPNAYELLRAGGLDFVSQVPVDQAPPLSGGSARSGPVVFRSYDVFAYYFVGWNAGRPILSDARVRTALSHTFHLGRHLKQSKKLGAPQSGPFFHRHPANDPTLSAIPFDPATARELINEAGWMDSDADGVREKTIDGEEVELRIEMLVYSTWVGAFEVWAEQLADLGVIMTLTPLAWPEMQRAMDRRDFDAFSGGWGLSWAIDPYQIWHSSQADVAKGSNRVGFRNERADEIIERLRTTFDVERRIELAREFHRIVHAEQPYTFMYAPQNIAAWNERVKNVSIRKVRPQVVTFDWWLERP